MVVQHNMQAMNANRMLNITTSAQAKSTEKLSSGYRINRAADDAAGLSISEKMRKQIKGLDKAASNAQDGISAVQTAEGALTEVHSMLQRMNELATQASNGTNSEADRQSIQDEISQLTTEIDRVAETTKFNETYLLKGGKTTEEKILAGHDAGIKGTFVDSGSTTASLTVELKVGESISIAGQNYNIVEGTDDDDDDIDTASDSLKKIQADIKAIDTADQTISINGTEYKSKTVDGNLVFDAGTGNTYNAEEMAGKITDGTSVKYGSATTAVIARDYTDTANITKGDAVEKIKQALTQANNIGATKTQATVTPQEEALVKLGDEGSIIAKTDLLAYNSSTGEVTKVGAGDDISKLQETGSKFYKGVTGDVTLSTDDKYDKDLLIVHDATGTAGVHKTWTAGTAITAETGVTTINTHKLAAASNYAIYEEVNVLSDTTDFELSATHEAYAELTSDNTGTTHATFSVAFASLDSLSVEDAEKVAKGQNKLKASIGEISYTNDGTTGTFGHDFADSNLDIDKDGNVTYDGVAIATITAGNDGNALVAGTDTLQLAAGKPNVDAVVKTKGDSDTVTFNITKGTTEVAKDLTLNLHVGADADMTNKISVDVAAMDSKGLGISGINVADDSGVAATYAVDAIEDAIKTVSAQRSSLGAVQNRLEHTIANLDNVVENTTSAESSIRDTDMATEMVNFSKNNILAQAGQSMLAQANQSNQGVLSLLG